VLCIYTYSQTCIKKSPLRQIKGARLRHVTSSDSIHRKFSITRQEIGDCLIEVTPWAGFTSFVIQLLQEFVV
jgi:hypothetical protein